MGVRIHAASLAESLTRQFYDWEWRGRGWLLWDEPVQLEPPFEPFRYHLPDYRPAFDDGRRHTWFSGLVAYLTESAKPSNDDPADEAGHPIGYPEPDGEPADHAEYELLLPQEITVPKQAMLHWLLSLSLMDSPVAFEILGQEGSVSYRLACHASASRHLLAQCHAHLQGAVLRPVERPLRESWPGTHTSLVVDFGLSEEFLRPLQCFRSFELDPLQGVIAVLDGLDRGEAGLLQVLFQPCAAPWAASLLAGVSDGEGGNFFADAPEMLAMARDKIAYPLYAATLRLGIAARGSERRWDLARALSGALSPLNLPASNSLLALSNEHYGDASHLEALLHRRTFRSGMILNGDELLGLAHPPSASVRTPSLARASSQAKAAPEPALGEGVILGENLCNGAVKVVRLSTAQRIRHTHLIGASGTGKSTLLLNLIRQDLEQGAGLAVLDPHGDLIDDILLLVPEHRVEDVIVFDPADGDYPVGFNVLTAHSEAERNLIASDFVGIFQRLATSWGDQMTTVFSNTVLAFLESRRGGSLSDMRRFLVEKEFRAEYLKSVTDPHLVYYWQREFPLLSGRPQSPILTRLDTFLRSRLIRNIVSQPENKLDFRDIMDSGKVLLARLSQGAIGEENACLLGSLLVSKIHQAALARQALDRPNRRPYFLYIDEFHNFVTPSMAALLSGVRKYGLGLVLAHQELRQLERRDSEVAHAVLANPYTRIAFRVGEHDARRLAEGFSSFEAADFLNLGVGEALVRMEQARNDFNLRTFPCPAPDADSHGRRERIIALSRDRYATPRSTVEEALALPEASMVESRPERTAPTRSRRTTVELPDLNDVRQEAAPAARVSRPVSRDEEVVPQSAAKLMGKGGQEHRYLQQLIKRWAEGMGYKADIERPLENGGSVDLVLEKGSVVIACEVAVTTRPPHELQNLCKCLSQGYTQVAMVGMDPKKVNRLRELAEKALPPEELEHVLFCEPSGLFQFIQEQEARAASTEATVRGYRVNVQYAGLDDEQRTAKRNAISRVVAQALGRKGRE